MKNLFIAITLIFSSTSFAANEMTCKENVQMCADVYVDLINEMRMSNERRDEFIPLEVMNADAIYRACMKHLTKKIEDGECK